MTTQTQPETLLDGKVTRIALPCFKPGEIGSNVPAKRLLLPQGELAQVLSGTNDGPMRYLAVIKLLPGCIRGNHYHKTKTEWVYLVEGRVRLGVSQGIGSEPIFLEVSPGDLVFISPQIYHAFNPLTGGLAIEFSDVAFDAADVYRANIQFPIHGPAAP